MTSENPKMGTQGTAGTRNHVMLTILQKLKKIWRCENGKGHSGYVSMQLSIVNYLCYEETGYNPLLQQVKVKGPFQATDIARA